MSMNVHPDYGFVRRERVCPLCLGPKDLGLVCCWGCYRSRDVKHCNPEAEAIIAKREIDLIMREAS